VKISVRNASITAIPIIQDAINVRQKARYQMQIVIDIPNEAKEVFDKASKDDIYGCFYDYNSLIGNAIKNGVVLPEKHGRLIDADEVDDAIYKCFEGIQFYDGTGYDIYSDSKESIDKIPTIIEADTESEGHA
jgi:hypothetical protein